MKEIAKILVLFIIGLSASCAMSSQSGYFEYRGQKVYYEKRGESRKALVFIHGFTSSSSVWKFQLNEFQDYMVLAVDLPGNGKSGKNEALEYSPEFFADSVYALLRKVKAEKVVLIGHSMGFAVVDVMTQKYPEIIAGICSVDGSFFEYPEDPGEAEEWIKSNREFAAMLNSEAGRDSFVSMLFRADTPVILKEEVLSVSKKVPLKIAVSMINGIEKDRKYFQKKTVSIPCLAVYSPAYMLPADYDKTLRKTFINLDYHFIPEVSHFFMLEAPYKLNQIIADFAGKTL